MKYQIVSVTEHGRSGLAFYTGETPEEALATFLRDMCVGMALVFDGPGAIHPENGKPAELSFDGEKFHAVPVGA